MPINRKQLLPRFVMDMEQMQDLLSVEQRELDILAEQTELSQRQLFISTATSSLARYEMLFALPVDNALPEELRKSKIIAKLNARSPGTVDFIRNSVELITGLPAAVAENVAEYQFMVTVYLNGQYMLDRTALDARLEEIKPAHLSFSVTVVDQVPINLPVRIGVMAGIGIEYRISVNWSVSPEQSILLHEFTGISTRIKKSYPIEVN